MTDAPKDGLILPPQRLYHVDETGVGGLPSLPYAERPVVAQVGIRDGYQFNMSYSLGDGDALIDGRRYPVEISVTVTGTLNVSIGIPDEKGEMHTHHACLDAQDIVQAYIAHLKEKAANAPD